MASAKASEAAKDKKRAGKALEGYPVHSMETMLAELGTRCRHTCSTPGSEGADVHDVPSNREVVIRLIPLKSKG